MIFLKGQNQSIEYDMQWDTMRNIRKGWIKFVSKDSSFLIVEISCEIVFQGESDKLPQSHFVWMM